MQEMLQNEAFANLRLAVNVFFFHNENDMMQRQTIFQRVTLSGHKIFPASIRIT